MVTQSPNEWLGALCEMLDLEGEAHKDQALENPGKNHRRLFPLALPVPIHAWGVPFSFKRAILLLPEVMSTPPSPCEDGSIILRFLLDGDLKKPDHKAQRVRAFDPCVSLPDQSG